MTNHVSYAWYIERKRKGSKRKIKKCKFTDLIIVYYILKKKKKKLYTNGLLRLF